MVNISIDGVLCLKIVDPICASYGVENPIYAIMQFGQMTMQSELGKIILDKTFEEQDMLNENIVKVINENTIDWGFQCSRYEIWDISPPPRVMSTMEMPTQAKHREKNQLLEFKGKRQANINIVDGKRSFVILESKATMMD